MKIAILTPVLHEGDAISNDVYGMYRVLRTDGHNVRLFADQTTTTAPSAPLAASADFVGADDLCIYHHSIGCSPGVAALRRMHCRRLVKYHNVTPAHFYRDDLKLRLECAKGVSQLDELVELGCEFVAASDYNARDVRRLRPDLVCGVLPPYNQLDAMAQVTPDYPAVLPYHDAQCNVLMVGRVAPNKNVVRGVEAFARFAREVRGQARLLVVGDPGDGRYRAQVVAAAARLGVSAQVILVGKVGLRQLKAFYLVADVLLLISEHEGFGVPLVEALAFRVPVVASDTTGLPDTGGDCARYVDPLDEEAVAAALGLVTCDADLREELMLRGRARYEARFTNARIDAGLRALVGRIAAAQTDWAARSLGSS